MSQVPLYCRKIKLIPWTIVHTTFVGILKQDWVIFQAIGAKEYVGY